jgi:hypothetical protein
MVKSLRQLELESGIDIYGLGLDRVKWEAALTRLIALALNDANIQLQEIKNRLAILEAGNMHSDKGYELSTHEKQAEFAKKRNYDIGDCV